MEQNSRKFLWMTCIFLAGAYIALESPYTLLFHTRVVGWQAALDGFFSVLFAMDFYFKYFSNNQFKRLFLDKDHDQILKNQKQSHSWKKVNNVLNFAIDGINTIPFDVIAFLIGNHSLLTIFRLLRLFRVMKVYSVIKKQSFVPIYFHILIILVGFLIVINLIGCGWILLYPKPLEISSSSYYIKAIYWSITTVATVGYGDITPADDLGRIYASLVMVVGVGMYTVIIGNVTRLMAIRDRHKDQSREKMNDLLMFMDHYNIPKNLRESAMNHYHHILTKRLSDNDDQIISELPLSLKKDMQLYMKIKLIEKLPLFTQCSFECLKEISEHLEQVYFGPGEKVIKIGDIGHELFIISHGLMEVTLDNKDVVARLSDGQFFGEIALLKDTPRTANVVSVEYSDLYMLTREKFLPLLEKYSVLKTNLDQLSKHRSK